MNPERFSPSFELKAETTAERGVFEGFASTFGGPADAHGDIIAPGAFAKSLAVRVPAMLWAHNQTEPVGKWLEVKETQRGLYVKGKLTLGTKRGADAYALAKDDALGLSIGFRVPSGGADYDGENRILSEIDLHEISLVALPANVNAKITAVKSARLDITSPRDIERTLRQIGLSQRQAKRLMADGYKGLLKPDEDERLEMIAAKFETLTKLLRT